MTGGLQQILVDFKLGVPPSSIPALPMMPDFLLPKNSCATSRTARLMSTKACCKPPVTQYVNQGVFRTDMNHTSRSVRGLPHGADRRRRRGPGAGRAGRQRGGVHRRRGGRATLPGAVPGRRRTRSVVSRVDLFDVRFHDARAIRSFKLDHVCFRFLMGVGR